MSTRETELFHYGIMGMKWGVRRYQNKDGSYTAAGAKRYNKSQKKYESTKADYKSGSATKEQYKSAKKEYKESKKSLQKDIQADRGKELSDKGVTKNEMGAAYAASCAGIVASGFSAGLHGDSTLNTLATIGSSVAAAYTGSSYSSIKEYEKRQSNKSK